MHSLPKPAKKTEKVFHEYLSSKLSDLPLWEHKRCWEQLFRHLVNKKIEERTKKLSPSYEPISLNLSNINVIGKTVMRNILKVGKNMIGLSENKPSQQIPVSHVTEADLAYFALEEINFHMINLGLRNELTIDLIIELGMKLFLGRSSECS